jgi:hypothetical protein
MKILLLAPSYLHLYKDVINELEKQGHEVHYVEDKSFPKDPCLIRNSQVNESAECLFGEQLKKYWMAFWNQRSLTQFDLLFVINGKSFHPYLKERLLEVNPSLKTVLYLWDRCYLNYRFDKYIEEFDKVVVFDKVDAKELKAHFLPFYWVPPQNPSPRIYDVSGFGTMREDRYELFKSIRNIVLQTKMNYFIKLYVSPPGKSFLSKVKHCLRNLFGGNHWEEDLVTHQTLTPSEFRNLIFQSKCIIDTYNSFQEGMTPRFMWALGAGCKIITTNAACRTYPFYSDDYIFVVDENHRQISKEFLTNDYKHTAERQNEINNYRIDNWVKEILKGI